MMMRAGRQAVSQAIGELGQRLVELASTLKHFTNFAAPQLQQQQQWQQQHRQSLYTARRLRGASLDFSVFSSFGTIEDEEKEQTRRALGEEAFSVIRV